VLAAGPAHSGEDRSLSVKLDNTAPDGFVVYSHAGDDNPEFELLLGRVKAMLGATS
jgi:hypothetical protein